MSDLTELGKVLHEEHFRILVLICGLENRVTGASAARPVDPTDDEDRTLLEELVSSLGQVIEHNVFEEKMLFPLLSSRGEDDLASLLAQEHVVIGPMATRVRGLAAEILRCGAGGERSAEFGVAAAELVSEMLMHLQKEEMAVVQRLSTFLDAETDVRLARAMTAERSDDGCETSSDTAGRPAVVPRRFSPATSAARSAARRRSSTPSVARTF
jgi:hemerythrin-like domain-containing protein